MFALKFLKLPQKNPVKVFFNQACKYALTVTKFCKGEVILPFFVKFCVFNLVAHIIFKKEKVYRIFFQTVLTLDNSSFNSFKAMDGSKLQKYGPFNETVFTFFDFLKT